MISSERRVESFADDLNTRRGIVSGRVALLPRSTEIQPHVASIRPSPFQPTHPYTCHPCRPRGWKHTSPATAIALAWLEASWAALQCLGLALPCHVLPLTSWDPLAIPMLCCGLALVTGLCHMVPSTWHGQAHRVPWACHGGP